MQQIVSFQVDHIRLEPGLYVSRIDYVKGNPLTSFDIRFCKPNAEPVMETAPIHTIEHLAATFLRNSQKKDEVIYFGPMGCRTGFYLIMAGRLSSKDILPLIKETFAFVKDFSGEIPGASPVECGNCLDHDLPAAKRLAAKYFSLLQEIGPENLNYPQ